MLLEGQIVNLKRRKKVVQLILRIAHIVIVRVVALEHLHDEVWFFLLGRRLTGVIAIIRLILVNHSLRRAHLCEVHVGIVNLHQVIRLFGLIKPNRGVWFFSARLFSSIDGLPEFFAAARLEVI